MQKLFILGDECLSSTTIFGFLKANLTFHIAFIAANKVKQDINNCSKMIIYVENQSIARQNFQKTSPTPKAAQISPSKSH